MKKTILFNLEELKELIENKFNCGVRFNVLEKELDNEIVSIDILEVFHNNKKVVDLGFPYLEHKDENFAIIELSDLHYILNSLFKEEFTEIYDFIEVDIGNGIEECILFNLK